MVTIAIASLAGFLSQSDMLNPKAVPTIPVPKWEEKQKVQQASAVEPAMAEPKPFPLNTEVKSEKDLFPPITIPTAPDEPNIEKTEIKQVENKVPSTQPIDMIPEAPSSLPDPKTLAAPKTQAEPVAPPSTIAPLDPTPPPTSSTTPPVETPAPAPSTSTAPSANRQQPIIRFIDSSNVVVPSAPAATALATAGGPRIYGQFDYLLWQFGSNTAPPLATNSNNTDNGVLGRPSTVVLFGGDYSNGFHSGYRGTFGAFLDPASSTAIETSVMYFTPRSRQWAFYGTPTSILGLPFYNATPSGIGGLGNSSVGTQAGENAFRLSSNDGTARYGNMIIQASSNLWGSELNSILRTSSGAGWNLDTILGFRYMQLDESLSVHSTTFRLNTDNSNVFRPASYWDYFATRNQFYGGQVGWRGNGTMGRFFVNGSAKLAMGYTRGSLQISGRGSDPSPIYQQTYGSTYTGLLTTVSNVGSYQFERFTIAPETQFNVGVNLSNRVRFSVGYDFLFMSNMLRPGQQIDRHINLNQVAITDYTRGTAALAGPRLPEVSPVFDGFIAHGVNFGLNFSY